MAAESSNSAPKIQKAPRGLEPQGAFLSSTGRNARSGGLRGEDDGFSEPKVHPLALSTKQVFLLDGLVAEFT